MNWVQILVALFVLEQAVERARQGGLSGKVNVLVELKPESPGIPPIEIPVGSVIA